MNFTLATIEEITHAGYVRGRNIAAAQDLRRVGDTYHFQCEREPRPIEDEDEAATAMTEDSYLAEDNNRQYTPFEFTAHEINSRPDSEEAWAAFGEGIDRGIGEEIAARIAAMTKETA